uniref:Uncharacterized protein n=1 Tax=Anguilla anguilla TaxID=7936 RepID=A0A0E9SYR3_ANGAN
MRPIHHTTNRFKKNKRFRY